ncbi:unnamed protein product [Aureobasidium uvarum]|uniref:Bromo domain-containing protein n=1 Tax=Aureobasidium uvarum TaxID=2773716 RepID=A0A9N8PXE7_9PEZI|nr:unnamed protein product [Aureobasidium uvarum]
MPSRKRDRKNEPASKSTASNSAAKRARTADAEKTEKTFRCVDRLDEVYSDLFIIWSQTMTLQQRKFLTSQLGELMRLQSARPLLLDKDMKFYRHMIKRPISLSTMRNTLVDGAYTSVSDFCADFKIIITNVHLAFGESGSRPMDARRLFRCFCKRMRKCPTGPEGETAYDYDRRVTRFVGSQTTDVKTKAPKLSSERLEVISIGSDEDQLDEVATETETDHSEDFLSDSVFLDDELEDYAVVETSISLGLVQGEPFFSQQTAKTPEPDDLDEEARQLHKEIEERQQKLADMAEKKKLLAEIRDLDNKKAEVDDKNSETERQLEQLNSNMEDCFMETHKLHFRSQSLKQRWSQNQQEKGRFQQESERLRQETERNQHEMRIVSQEKGTLELELEEYNQTANKLDSDQAKIEGDRQLVLEDGVQLRKRRDELENQRAIAKKKLEELNSGNF